MSDSAAKVLRPELHLRLPERVSLEVLGPQVPHDAVHGGPGVPGGAVPHAVQVDLRCGTETLKHVN